MDRQSFFSCLPYLQICPSSWPPRVTGGSTSVVIRDHFLSVEPIGMDGTTNHGPIVFVDTTGDDPSLSVIDICIVTSKMEPNSPGSVSTCLSMSPRTPNHNCTSMGHHSEERTDVLFRINAKTVYHATNVVKMEFKDSNPPSLLILFDSCVFRIFHSESQSLQPALTKLLGITSSTTAPSLKDDSRTSQEEEYHITSELHANQSSAPIEPSVIHPLKRKADSIELSWSTLCEVNDLLQGPATAASHSALHALITSSAQHLSDSFTAIATQTTTTSHDDLNCSAQIQSELDCITATVFPAPRRNKLSSPFKPSQHEIVNWEASIKMTKGLMEKHATAVKRKYACALAMRK